MAYKEQRVVRDSKVPGSSRASILLILTSVISEKKKKNINLELDIYY